MDMNALSKLSAEWGVSVASLIYRCREIGLIPEATYRRAFQRLNQLTNMGLFQPHPVRDYPGEVPRLLIGAYQLAEAAGLTVPVLADELCVRPRQVRLLLGMPRSDRSYASPIDLDCRACYPHWAPWAAEKAHLACRPRLQSRCGFLDVVRREHGLRVMLNATA